MIELIAGRWSVAQELATRERNIVALYETVAWPGPFFVLAELALHRGELDEARELAAHGHELAVADAGLLGRRRGQPRSRGLCGRRSRCGDRTLRCRGSRRGGVWVA